MIESVGDALYYYIYEMILYGTGKQNYDKSNVYGLYGTVVYENSSISTVGVNASEVVHMEDSLEGDVRCTHSLGIRSIWLN